MFDNFFWPGRLHQVGALKKPPGATWVHLVANGPPISISTWCILFVRRPRWILGRLAVLAAEKEVSPGGVDSVKKKFRTGLSESVIAFSGRPISFSSLLTPIKNSTMQAKKI